MKSIALQLVVASLLAGSVTAGTSLEYDFSGYNEQSISGQFGWSLYPKIKGSKTVSIVDGVGATDAVGDFGLVILPTDKKVRCVSGEPVRWMPGQSLTVMFDFKVVVPPDDLFSTCPVVSFFVGNSLLSKKGRWGMRVEALPGGDWQLSGAFPDAFSKKIYAENFLIRQVGSYSVSDWFTFVLVVEKSSDPDSFTSQIDIKNAAGETIAMVEVDENLLKDRLTATMWNVSRLHVGFGAEQNQYGLATIDNIKVSVSE